MSRGLVAVFALSVTTVASCGASKNSVADGDLSAHDGGGTASGGRTGADVGVIDGGDAAIDAGGGGGVGGSGGTVAQGAGGSELLGCPLAPASADGGESDGSDGGSESPCPTVDMPPSDAAALHIYQLAAPQQQADLQRFVGQYACGDSPLYRGTFSASESTGSLVMDQENGVMGDGPVIAALENDDVAAYPLTCDQTAVGVRLLVVNSIAEMRAIRLRQFLSGSGDTYSSLVALPRQGWRDGLSKCSGCVADFRSGSPQVIDVNGSTFQAPACFGSATVTPSGHLAILAEPSFDDIMEIDHVAGDQANTPVFTAQGGDMVRTVYGSVGELGPPGMGCAHTVVFANYQVDWYVNRQNPRIRGLRNFSISAQGSECCDSLQ